MKKVLIAVIVLLNMITLTQMAEAAGRVSSDRTSIPVNRYVIKKGDNLWNIAKRYHCTVRQLRELNPQLTQQPKTNGEEYPGMTEGQANANNNVVKPNDTITIPSTETMTDVEAQVLTLVNQARVKAGLKDLQGDDNNLNKSARAKAKDMAENNYFSHQSPTLGSPFDQMRTFGVNYKSAGENIAQGQKTAQEVFNSWMNSSGHKANIMNGEYTHLGVGYVSDGNYWCQQFISK